MCSTPGTHSDEASTLRRPPRSLRRRGHLRLSNRRFNLPPLISSHVNTNKSSDLTYRSRFLLYDSADYVGLSGLLVLPGSPKPSEIQTDRQRILLLDTSKSPVESIRAGGRYDFIVERDVKKLTAHTLVCAALYSDGEGERKYLLQFSKFIVANSLSVRTKVRAVKEITFLEACIENYTKSDLYMGQVEFERAQNWL